MVVTLDEEINNSLFTYNPDMILITDLEYRIKKVNPSTEKILGADCSSYLDTVIFNYISASDMDVFLHQFQTALQFQVTKAKIDFIHKNGHIVHSITKIIPKIEQYHPVGAYIIIEDIQQTYPHYLDTIKNEQLFRTMAENSLDIITIRNLSGEYQYTSPAVKQILGYEPEEFIGTYRHHYVNLHDHDQQCQSLYDQHQICTYCYRIRRKDGKYIWLESTVKPLLDPETNEPTGYLSISRDITDRKKIEKAVQDKQNLYHRLVEESPFATMIFQKGKMVFLNETAVWLLGGKSKKDILSLNMNSFVHPDQLDAIRTRRGKLLKGQSVPLMVQRWIRIDGKEIEVEAKGIRTIFNDKPAVQIIAVDKTERNQLYEMVRNTEKLSLVGQLAAGLVHEIRNPLTSIKGFLQLIETGLIKQEYFDIIHSEFYRIELILTELLVVSRPHISVFNHHLIQDIIYHVITLMEPQAILHNIEFRKELTSEPIQIECDENQIKQLFLNILKNAIEAMPEGGQILIKMIVDSSFVLLQVVDQGHGIPKEWIEKIGQPFFTTKENGTGLGMMVSQQIVKNHKGTLQLYSKEKKEPL
ncbi:PAS domain S-box protein [Tepidibacillus marianensis]|uniref:PAS domain S-box protein n=1 Tax=Tepidibacillus marianensis TaxID=3131995 RepID=UPI0030D59FCA